MAPWLTRLAIAGGLAALAGFGARAAEPLSGAILAPPAGTVAEYTHTKVRFGQKAGPWIPYEERARGDAFTGAETGATFSWLFGSADRAAARFDERAARALLPLRTGKAAEIDLIVGTTAWRLSIEVVGTDQVVVPAGDFKTWVIRVERQLAGGGAAAVTTRWYAPAFGLTVRSEHSFATGVGRIDELERIIYPQTFVNLRRITLYSVGEALYSEADFETAVYAWEQAAHWGDAGSMKALAKLYATGNGVELDPVKAYTFYELAARAGSRTAAGSRDDLAAAMTAAQIGEAKAAVAAWKPRPRP